uniref:Beta-lactamase-like protein 2 homolog n=1 Tax=Trichuris muris TaxID=70415 RepID=A0A5S6QWF8_TRIMR
MVSHCRTIVLAVELAFLVLACCSSQTSSGPMSAFHKPLPYIASVSGTVLRLLGRNPGPFTLQGTNTYLVGNGRKRILIDTGVSNDSDYLHDLKHLIVSSNVEISTIVCTHWHLDHTGGVNDILKLLLNIGQSRPTVLKYDVGSKVDEDNYPETLDFEFEFLRDGQEIVTSGATLRVVHTPGHTSDHVALQFLEENSLFSGDCILGHGSTAVGDMASYMKSLERLKEMNPVKLYPGHGPVVEDGLGLIVKYIAHRGEREKEILSILKGSNSSLTAKQIADLVYKQLSADLHRAAERNVLKHLTKLLDSGKLECVDGKWSIIRVTMSALPKLSPKVKRKKGAIFSSIARSQQLRLKAAEGKLIGLTVTIEDADAGRELNVIGGFGKFTLSDRSHGPPESSGQLCLFLEEAWFLASSLNCLRVVNCMQQEIAPNEFLELCKSMRPNFISLYAVYFHFRSKNWIVAQGTNYGVDFVLYADLPSIAHSSYLVLIRPNALEEHRCPLTFRNLACYSRLAATVSKQLLLCSVGIVDNQSAVPNVQVMTVSQWFANCHFTGVTLDC